jgi:hypothetical protein
VGHNCYQEISSGTSNFGRVSAFSLPGGTMNGFATFVHELSRGWAVEYVKLGAWLCDEESERGISD